MSNVNPYSYHYQVSLSFSPFYARMASTPHPSSFYVLHTRFPIFHAYHMQIYPSLVPPSLLDLALLPLSLSLSLSLRNTMWLKSRVLFLLLCATCHTTVSFTNGPLPKGNFEYGPKPWEISGCVEYIKSGQKQGDVLLIVPEGAYAVRLRNEASIKQRVKVVKGMYSSITFSAARTCAQEETLNVSVAPDSEANDWGMLPMQTMNSSNGWDSYAWGFQADDKEIVISIHNPGGRGNAGGVRHHRILFDKYHPGYFGKVGMRNFRKLRSKFYCPIVNIGKLWSMVPPAVGAPSEGDFQAEGRAVRKMKFGLGLELGH